MSMNRDSKILPILIEINIRWHRGYFFLLTTIRTFWELLAYDNVVADNFNLSCFKNKCSIRHFNCCMKNIFVSTLFDVICIITVIKILIPR